MTAPSNDDRDTYACAEHAAELGEDATVRALENEGHTGDLRAYVRACVKRWARCDDCGEPGATAHGSGKRCARCATEVADERALDVRVRIESDDDDPIECTLDAFLADNADGLDGAERATIVAYIGAGRVYEGGGGAAPAWRLVPLDE